MVKKVIVGGVTILICICIVNFLLKSINYTLHHPLHHAKHVTFCKKVKVHEYQQNSDPGFLYVINGLNNYLLYSSPTRVTDFSSVTFTKANSLPEETKTETPKELEVNEKEFSEVESEINQNEISEVPETPSNEPSTETSNESPSDAPSESPSDGGSDGGSGDGGGSSGD